MGDLNDLFQGTIAIVAPHMDDEALACGGLIALLPKKERIHIVYVTDGMMSPSPVLPGRDQITPDLGIVRMQESRAAMALLEVAEGNLHFLGLPEARLKDNIPALLESLRKIIYEINPTIVFMPFRYDRHPDHLAVNQVLTGAIREGWYKGKIFEYFIYYRSRLFPARDIRKYIKPQLLIKIDINDVSGKKRRALDCYKTQTTIYYSWQTRPILTSILLDEECSNPEFFLILDPSLPGATVFSKNSLWIRLANRCEPHLVKWKYLISTIIKRSYQKVFRFGR